MDTAKILVTGATGTVGSQLAAALADAGADLRVGIRSPEKASELADRGVEVVAFDFDDPPTMAKALAGADRLFLLTPFVEEPVPLVEAAVRAAKEAGVSFILRMSAAGADPDSPGTLSRHHGEGEEVVKASGLDWCVIRPMFFMDNLVNLAAASIASQGAFYGAAGDGKVAYIDSADIADTAAAILADPTPHVGQTYVLTGPEAVTESDVADRLSELLDRDVRYVSLRPEEHRKALVNAGLPEWMVDALVFLESVKANGWAAAVSPVVESITGQPGRKLVDFLTAHTESFQSR